MAFGRRKKSKGLAESKKSRSLSKSSKSKSKSQSVSNKVGTVRSDISTRYEARLGREWDLAQRRVSSVLSLDPSAAKAALLGRGLRHDHDSDAGLDADADDDDSDAETDAFISGLGIGSDHAKLVWQARDGVEKDLGLLKWLSGPDGPDRKPDGSFHGDANEVQTLTEDGRVNWKHPLAEQVFMLEMMRAQDCDVDDDINARRRMRELAVKQETALKKQISAFDRTQKMVHKAQYRKLKDELGSVHNSIATLDFTIRADEMYKQARLSSHNGHDPMNPSTIDQNPAVRDLRAMLGSTRGRTDGQSLRDSLLSTSTAWNDAMARGARTTIQRDRYDDSVYFSGASVYTPKGSNRLGHFAQDADGFVSSGKSKRGGVYTRDRPERSQTPDGTAYIMSGARSGGHEYPVPVPVPTPMPYAVPYPYPVPADGGYSVGAGDDEDEEEEEDGGYSSIPEQYDHKPWRSRVVVQPAAPESLRDVTVTPPGSHSTSRSSFRSHPPSRSRSISPSMQNTQASVYMPPMMLPVVYQGTDQAPAPQDYQDQVEVERYETSALRRRPGPGSTRRPTQRSLAAPSRRRRRPWYDDDHSDEDEEDEEDEDEDEDEGDRWSPYPYPQSARSYYRGGGRRRRRSRSPEYDDERSSYHRSRSSSVYEPSRGSRGRSRRSKVHYAPSRYGRW